LNEGTFVPIYLSPSFVHIYTYEGTS